LRRCGGFALLVKRLRHGPPDIQQRRIEFYRSSIAGQRIGQLTLLLQCLPQVAMDQRNFGTERQRRSVTCDSCGMIARIHMQVAQDRMQFSGSRVRSSALCSRSAFGIDIPRAHACEAKVSATEFEVRPHLQRAIEVCDAAGRIVERNLGPARWMLCFGICGVEGRITFKRDFGCGEFAALAQ
jgi:hypothetical protein